MDLVQTPIVYSVKSGYLTVIGANQQCTDISLFPINELTSLEILPTNTTFNELLPLKKIRYLYNFYNQCTINKLSSCKNLSGLYSDHLLHENLFLRNFLFFLIFLFLFLMTKNIVHCNFIKMIFSTGRGHRT